MNNDHIIKWSIILSLFCVFLVIIDISTTVILHDRESDNSNRISNNTERINRNSSIIVEAEFATCERVNVLRHSDNISHWVQWLQIQQSIKRSILLAEKEPSTKDIRLKGNKENENLSRKIIWTPLTNCKEATANPLTYQAPKPRGFSKINLMIAPADSS